MKKSLLRLWIGRIFFISVSVLFLHMPLCARADVSVYDDFNDGSIDIEKWNIMNVDGLFTEANGKLNFSATAPTNRGDYNLKSKYLMPRMSTAWIEYSNFFSSNTSLAGQSLSSSLSFDLVQAGEITNLVSIYRGKNGGFSSDHPTDFIQVLYRQGNTNDRETTYLLSSPSASGMIGFLIDGSIVQPRYNPGLGPNSEWQEIGPPIPLTNWANPPRVQISSYNGPTGSMIFSVDNIFTDSYNSAPTVAPDGGGAYDENSSVVLGGHVSDMDGDTLTYEWWEKGVRFFRGTIDTKVGGDPVGLTPLIISNLSVGVHILTLRVSDRYSKSVDANVRVIKDTTAPIITPAPDKTILWPANGKMDTVTIIANASDNSGQPVTLTASVSSNEPVNGHGDGNTSSDWTEPVIMNGIITLQLRAERSGKGDGRIYTITIVATDKAGLTSTAEVNILVPHDQGK